MIKRTLIVLATILAIIFIPYFLGMIDILGIDLTIPLWLRGFCIILILIIIICLLILIALHLIFPIYEYIKYGN